MKKLDEVLRFVVDTVAAYLNAMVLLIPVFNVLYLRSIMEDSIKLNKIKKKYLKRK